jgi:ABC-type polysaccharide/polyol phosphate transport system ATPase subunit
MKMKHKDQEVTELKIWLEAGHVKMIGNPQEVVAAYEAS